LNGFYGDSAVNWFIRYELVPKLQAPPQKGHLADKHRIGVNPARFEAQDGCGVDSGSRARRSQILATAWMSGEVVIK
jgi:hypothetical protein